MIPSSIFIICPFTEFLRVVRAWIDQQRTSSLPDPYII